MEGIEEQARSAPGGPRPLLLELAGEIAAIVRRTWGRGPARTTAHWAGRDMLVVLMEDGHTPAERALLAAGEARHVLAGRASLQAILAEELETCVQRATGRRVSAMLSANHLDPDLSAEIFLLESDQPTDPPARDPDQAFEHARAARANAEEAAERARAVQQQARQALHHTTTRRQRNT